MIRSMTGFARCERQTPAGTLLCELRTVNHRYLEVSLRLPDELRSAEADVRQLIAQALRRGKVDAGIYFKPAHATAARLELDEEVLGSLLTRVTDLTRRFDLQGGSGALNPLEILKWPGVVREAERSLGPGPDDALAVVAETLQALNEARSREGARLRELIQQRCAALSDQVAAVKARLPEVAARLRARMVERIAQLAQTTDPLRLEQELVFYAQRMDVDEEMDRLASHVIEITSILGSPEPAGRRLDFLMQELNREANTLSSKSQDVETTRAAVDMKVIIEQVREQVQNIE